MVKLNIIKNISVPNLAPNLVQKLNVIQI